MERYSYADLKLYAEAFGKEIMAPMAPIYLAFAGKAGGGAARCLPGPADQPWFRPSRPYTMWDIDSPAKWNLFRSTFGNDVAGKVGMSGMIHTKA